MSLLSHLQWICIAQEDWIQVLSWPYFRMPTYLLRLSISLYSVFFSEVWSWNWRILCFSSENVMCQLPLLRAIRETNVTGLRSVYPPAFYWSNLHLRFFQQLTVSFGIQLSQEEINLEKLQRIASKGIPDSGGLRARVWKVGIWWTLLRHFDLNLFDFPTRITSLWNSCCLDICPHPAICGIKS